MSYFTQEALQKLFDMLAEGWSMPKASAVACGVASKMPWVWIRNAKRERESGVSLDEAKYAIHDWPQDDEHHWIDHAYKLSQEMMRLNLGSQAIEEVMQLRKPVLDGSGNVSFQLDYKALAEWRGDKELARELGGLDDPFFAHDESGARIPLTMRAEIPSAMRIAALKAMQPETWDRPTTIDVNKRTTKAVLVLNERRPPQRETPLRADLKTRLAELRAKGPANPRPSHPVQTFRTTEDGPKERISNAMGDDAAKPLSLPAPTKQPEPQPNYGRRRTSALDAVDRPLGDGGNPMPSGGFSMSNLGPGGRPKAT